MNYLGYAKREEIARGMITESQQYAVQRRLHLPLACELKRRVNAVKRRLSNLVESIPETENYVLSETTEKCETES